MKYYLIVLTKEQKLKVLELDTAEELAGVVASNLKLGHSVVVVAGLIGKFSKNNSVLRIGTQTFTLFEDQPDNETIIGEITEVDKDAEGEVQ